METLKEKISSLPCAPGCYIFRNKEAEIIYIGKSKSLRNRVGQYFRNVEAKEGKYRSLAREVSEVEIIRTRSERDALILECKLIKQNQPRYNVQMKRKKNYPYIYINTKADFPTITIEKECQENNGDYFGFFYNEDEAFETIQLLNAIWQTPICCKGQFPANHRPCLNYHLKKCYAPCIGQIGQQEYREKIKEAVKCLRGNTKPVLRNAESAMKKAATDMDFEKAAYYRNLVEELHKLQRKSRRLNTFFEDREVFLFFRAFNEKGFTVYYIAEGLVKGRVDFDEAAAGEELTGESTEAKLRLFLERMKPGVSGADEMDNLDFAAVGFDINNEKEQRFLTTCLNSVFGDKYYVTMPKRVNRKTAWKHLQKGLVEFMKGRE